MGARDAMMEVVFGLVDFGRVVSSRLESATKNVLARIGGNDDEERADQVLWGHAAILWRPLEDTEIMFVRRGEEMLPVASREVRWQIDLSEGDVVVRNLSGDHPVTLSLFADGTCVLEADQVKIGSATATEAIGLGTAIKSHLDDVNTYLGTIRTQFNTHLHPAGTLVAPSGGGPVTGATAVSATTMGAPPSVPDVESRHKVEN